MGLCCCGSSFGGGDAMKYETHPAADIFPMMSESAFQELKSDIAANGVK
jgi:hypothetical protein